MKMENTVFKDFTEQEFSEEILKGLIISIVEFMKEKNIDSNSIVDLSNDTKIKLYHKLNDILEYITIHIFKNNYLEELIKDYVENFNNSISEIELVKVKNEKYFIKKKDEIKDLILKIADVFELITNFKYINEHKEILFNDEPNDELNQKFGNSLVYVISYLSRLCENLNGINQIKKNLNDLLCKVKPNLTKAQLIKDLDDSFCKDNSNKTMKDLNDSICNKIKLVRDELDKIKFNLLKDEEHQRLIKEYGCAEIIKELNNKVYQKPFDELNDIIYQNEIRRIVNIYNNSSKELHDQIEVFNKMKYFIELGKDNQPFQTVFDAK